MKGNATTTGRGQNVDPTPFVRFAYEKERQRQETPDYRLSVYLWTNFSTLCYHPSTSHDHAKNPKYVFPLALVLAPTVYGCVNSQVNNLHTYKEGWMLGQFWHNAAKETPTCTINGPAGDGGHFHMQCTRDGFAVTIDPQGFGVEYMVRMTYADTDLTVLATQTYPNRLVRWACRYDCSSSDCFVPFDFKG